MVQRNKHRFGYKIENIDCMSIRKWMVASFITAGLGTAVVSVAQPAKEFVVKVNQPKAAIQPTMWGVFFEDINLGADGGIYAELVKTGPLNSVNL